MRGRLVLVAIIVLILCSMPTFNHSQDPVPIQSGSQLSTTDCFRKEVREYADPAFKTITTSYLLTMEGSK